MRKENQWNYATFVQSRYCSYLLKQCCYTWYVFRHQITISDKNLLKYNIRHQDMIFFFKLYFVFLYYATNRRCTNRILYCILFCTIKLKKKCRTNQTLPTCLPEQKCWMSV
uniref:Uncharacterized protein n=1 Tax=Cacopsylla melanoneura TaxID=428564 RepID=A0A8D8VQ28_9HEMI